MFEKLLYKNDCTKLQLNASQIFVPFNICYNLKKVYSDVLGMVTPPFQCFRYGLVFFFNVLWASFQL